MHCGKWIVENIKYAIIIFDEKCKEGMSYFVI